jgi:hypothetical protein
MGQVRVGVVERLDVGIRINDGDSFGADAKVWIVKSPVFDVAFVGGFDTYVIPGLFDEGTSAATRAYTGPLVGLNLSRAVSLTAWYAVTRLAWTGHPNSELDGVGQWTGQGGFGADVRVTPRFAIHRGWPSSTGGPAPERIPNGAWCTAWASAAAIFPASTTSSDGGSSAECGPVAGDAPRARLERPRDHVRGFERFVERRHLADVALDEGEVIALPLRFQESSEETAEHGQSGLAPMLPAPLQFIVAMIAYAINRRMKESFLSEIVRMHENVAGQSRLAQAASRKQRFGATTCARGRCDTRSWGGSVVGPLPETRPRSVPLVARDVRAP